MANCIDCFCGDGKFDPELFRIHYRQHLYVIFEFTSPNLEDGYFIHRDEFLKTIINPHPTLSFSEIILNDQNINKHMKKESPKKVAHSLTDDSESVLGSCNDEQEDILDEIMGEYDPRLNFGGYGDEISPLFELDFEVVWDEIFK